MRVSQTLEFQIRINGFDINLLSLAQPPQSAKEQTTNRGNESRLHELDMA